MTSIKLWVAAALTVLMAATAQAKDKMVTDLPDVSVIGNYLATNSPTGTKFDVKEIEFSFQHYLYPSVKADIFAALHKSDSGERAFELEEAIVTFTDLFDVLTPGTFDNPGVGAVVGKKLLSVGKTNQLHPEQWQFVDRPLIVKQVFGQEEGLSAEGAQVMYLLPLSFFSQLEVGAWSAAAHGHEEGEEHGSVEYSEKLLTTRLWNSFSMSDDQELEVGLNYLQGNATASSADDKQDIVGLDLSYMMDLGADKFLKVQSEFFQATYGEEGEERAAQSGGYISGYYQFDPYYQAGLRYGTLGQHGDEGDVKNQLSAMVTKKLTETSKFRLQFNTGENVDNTILAQFIFGMGPHAHVLQ